MEKVLDLLSAGEPEDLVQGLLKIFFDWSHPVLLADFAHDTVIAHRLTSQFKLDAQMKRTPTA
jgi:hypothetical protein